MSVLGLYCVLQVWTGLTSSSCPNPHIMHPLTSCRIKEKLRSGEMAVSGDQWPIFLYYGYDYNPEDPWNGLFRSTILVSVGFGRSLRLNGGWSFFRATSIYLRRRVPSTKSLRPRDPAMHGSTGWPKWRQLQLPTLQLRYETAINHVVFLLMGLNEGPICVVVVACILQDRHCNGFREVL